MGNEKLEQTPASGGSPLNVMLGHETKEHLMVTVKMFDGWPYGEVKIEPEYKAKGGETELLQEIVAVMRKWANER